MEQSRLEALAKDPGLRQMSPSVRIAFQRLMLRRTQKQRPFGGDLCVLNEETAKQSTGCRRSMAFETILHTMPVAIEPGDLIVGCCVENDTVVRCILPRFLKEEEVGKETVRLSHKCPGYQKLLQKGLLQLIREVEAEKAACPDPRWQDLAACMQREAQAVISLASRYAALAKKMAEKETDEQRKSELWEIARVCGRVPAYPAATFQEALQSVWFVNHAFRETEQPLSLGNLDRMLAPYYENDIRSGLLTAEKAQELVDSFCLRINDRVQTDPKNYVIDSADMPGLSRQERPCYETGFVDEPENDHADAINHWGQNILISGILPDGKDATSAVTYFFLNAQEKLHMTSPVLTVRLHKGSPALLMERVAEVIRGGGGMPYINNDDVLIPAYQALGVPFEDACGYANSNCWETLIQGASSQEMIHGFNFLYYLELVLNRGRSLLLAKAPPTTGIDLKNYLTWPSHFCVDNSVRDGIDTGDLSSFATFEQLMDAWKRQLDYMLSTGMDKVAHFVRAYGNMGPNTFMPLVSLLEDDCIENHLDVTHMGARYNLWHLMAEAVSNAADALRVIQKLVYEERTVSLEKLTECLRSDWQCEGAREVLSLMRQAEKFGNDQDAVDLIAADMLECFVRKGRQYAARYPDFIFPPCVGTFSWVISIGKRIAASADGRSSGAPIAANMSPAPGRDVAGPTAALNSYLKLDLSAMAAGAPIDLRLSSRGLEGEEGLKRLTGLIRAFIAAGGNMMTLTVTDIGELKDAMVHPENHAGLRVRMGGWSAYFTMLSKESQKMHLQRVEHYMV